MSWQRNTLYFSGRNLVASFTGIFTCVSSGKQTPWWTLCIKTLEVSITFQTSLYSDNIAWNLLFLKSSMLVRVLQPHTAASTVTIKMQSHLNSKGAELKKTQTQKVPPAVEGIRECISNQCLLQSAKWCYWEYIILPTSVAKPSHYGEKDYVITGSWIYSQSSWKWFVKIYSLAKTWNKHLDWGG